MNRMFSFLAGALAGSLVGAVTALFLTPASGEQLREDARSHWEYVLSEAQQARADKVATLESQFGSATTPPPVESPAA